MGRSNKHVARRRLALLALAGLGVGGALALSRRAPDDLHGKVVVITGSSRGLGIALAEECARQGASIVLCARDGQRLEQARQRISALGAATLAVPCDVTDQYQVEHLMEMALAEFGAIDVLINNASLLRVSPVEQSELQDFADAMDVAFWGTVYAALAVLPHMRERHSGRIVNITSIGGKVSVPHLLPYSSAKFAAVGFSEGLRAELAHTGVAVTTVIPDLPSIRAAATTLMPGTPPGNNPLFDLMTNAPATSRDTDRAARQIVAAIRRGDAEVVLSWQARVLASMHGLFAGRTSDVLDYVARYLSSNSAASTDDAPTSSDAVHEIPITPTSFLKNLSKEGL